MHESTMSHKRAAKEIESNPGILLVGKVIERGQNALEEISGEIGRIVAESVFLLEREALGGSDYHLFAAKQVQM
jgi:hypothetical protein